MSFLFALGVLTLKGDLQLREMGLYWSSIGVKDSPCFTALREICHVLMFTSTKVKKLLPISCCFAKAYFKRMSHSMQTMYNVLDG